MSKDLFFRISGLFAFVLLFMSVDVFGQIYTYDFGTDTGTADGSNANNGGAGITNFFTGTPAGGGTYRVRIGTAGGSLVLANPGTSLGTGSEAQLTASSNGAVNMFSVYNWNNPQQILYLKTKIRSTSSADGTITIALGNQNLGTTNTLATADALAFLRLNYTDGELLLTRSSGGGNTLITMGGTEPLMSQDTDQQLEFFVNNSPISQQYSKGGQTYTLNTRTWDLWLDNQKFNSTNGYGAANGSSGNGNIVSFVFAATNSPGNEAKIFIDDLFYATEFPPYEETIWNGAVWSNGVPDFDKKAVIAGSYDTATNGGFSANKLTVNTGNTLNISSNTSINILSNIINNGNIFVRNDANLIQSGNFVNSAGESTGGNSGSITLERQSRMKRLDYTFWGSPVKGQNLYGFSPQTLTNRIYKYDQSTDTFVTTGLSASSVFDPGVGYAIRAPNNFPATYSQSDPQNLFNGSFTGVPHNGSIPVVLASTGQGYNLVANPYPSNIDYRKVKTNNNLSVANTISFWTNSNPWDGGTSTYTANNYATYNNQSNTGVAAQNGTQVPNGIIKPGQGFLVMARYDGATLTFQNNQRTTSSGTFFNVALRGKETVPDRYWLKLTTPLNNFNSLAVVYTEGATNGYDDDIDSPIMIVGSDSFYTLADAHKIIIDGREFPFSTTDKVDLGFVAFQAGTHKISTSGKDGVFANGQPLYIHDKLQGTYFNLQDGDYVFETQQGMDNGRFEVVYEIPNLATGDNIKESVSIFSKEESFVVKSSETISNIQVYDTSGRLISTISPNAKIAEINSFSFVRGMYVMKISLAKGEVINKKVIKN